VTVTRSSWLPVTALSAVLIIAFVFLFLRTRADSAPGYLENEAVVRQIKQLDARWELDVMRSRTGINANYDALANAPAQISQLQARLDIAMAAAWHGNSRTLTSAQASFGEAFQDKIRLIERFKTHNSVLRNSVLFLPTAAEDARRATSAGDAINAILLDTLVYSQDPASERAAHIGAALARLPPHEGALGVFASHVATVLREQTVVNTLLRNIADVPAAARIDDFDRLLSLEKADADRQAQRDRTRLLVFAAGMVVMFLYAAARLIRSHATINRVNAALFDSNSKLEQRVAQRTLALKTSNAGLRESEARLALQAGELAAARDTALAADSAKSAFLATMSHELRTPLNAIIGFSELMRSTLFGPLGHPKYGEYVGDIQKSGTHLLALINDILDLSRLDAGRADLVEQDFSLADMIRDTCRSLQPLARQNGLALMVLADPGMDWLHGDARRIRQVVLNLVSNAIKFTPEGGRVTVRTMETAGCLQFDVEDTGIGIAAADLPKAMERFGQVDSCLARKFEGTGLGLPLTRQLVELHDGGLAIASEPKVGTRATVIFPAARSVRPPSQHQANIIPLREASGGVSAGHQV
jgi:two-component system NtrC family sensor kinase